jgi:NNP family nitrate/nitrite transporter-like MFS transporter
MVVPETEFLEFERRVSKSKVPMASASVATAMFPAQREEFQTFRHVGAERKQCSSHKAHAEDTVLATPDSQNVGTAMYPQRFIQRVRAWPSARQWLVDTSKIPSTIASAKKEMGTSVGDNVYDNYNNKLELAGRPFECEVDEFLKATAFQPFKIPGATSGPRGCGLHVGKSKRTNPHMRAFWFATLSFFLAFTGWFCLMPLTTIIREDIGICDNQERMDAGLDESCECKANCKATLSYAKMGNVGSTVVVRVIVGSMLELFGPVNVQCVLLSLGVLFCASAALFIKSAASFITVQTLLGVLGATFVTNQFWMPLNFSANVIGITNATAGGWGNVGGGFANLIMPLIYRLVKSVGHPSWLAWRLTMLFPIVALAVTVPAMKFFSQDTPMGKINCERDLKKKSVSVWDYVVVLKDVRVLVLALHYSACFGTELCVTQEVVAYFYTNFKLSLESAGMLGFMFGAMNLFARSLGGIVSDNLAAKFGMRGRLWAQFLILLGEAIALFCYGCISAEMGWATALVVLVIFSIFVQAAEGATYGLVPFVLPTHLGIVSAVVGAGGNVGAVIGQWAFYKPDFGDDYLLPYKLHSGYVLFCTLLTPLITFKYAGSMFKTTPVSRMCTDFLDYVIEWQQGTECYQILGSYTAPTRLAKDKEHRDSIANSEVKSPGKTPLLTGSEDLADITGYVAKSTTFKIKNGDAARQGIVTRAGRMNAPVFLPNVQYLDKSVYMRKDIALQSNVKSVLLIPLNDGKAVLECGSSKEMRLREGVSAQDLADCLFSNPAAAAECVQQLKPINPSMHDPSFSTKPIEDVLKPFFTYAIEWLKVGPELQVVGSLEEAKMAEKSFGTESCGVVLNQETFVYQKVLGGRGVPLFVENVGDMSDVEYPRKTLAQKHGIVSCLFLPCSEDRVIEIGSTQHLKLLDGVSAADIVAAIKAGSLGSRALFDANERHPAIQL